ncbi:hypothetical protein E4S40_15505 [Algoriphagus kandeliae]|uniref:Lipoprotein n=1 Tax=Algoriphagus kandeliae TaxID=2562278 RepID=A0A4Y9QP48_9BACT|nr:hypothetical protein [Algoriphagus kandeliae]TFV93648.1 hypothetical protein E4S40_15505 [Algoriphagus kandeliae]
MRKLTAFLALGAILYSCTETEKPDQLNLETQKTILNQTQSESIDIIQIPSESPKGSRENAMIMASFTPIDDVSGDYTTETMRIDISSLPCLSDVNDASDGNLTLNFDKTLNKRQVSSCFWLSWGVFPDIEDSNPHVLFSNGQNSLGISLSTPVSTFGFELLNNEFGTFSVQVDFFFQGELIGSIAKNVESFSGGQAKLFAAETDARFDYVLIQSEPSSGFAIAQLRYTEKNPFTVDVRPDSCENPVNVNSKGVIPVGILASMDLDVNDIDLSTVRLNGIAPKNSSFADLGGFYEKEEACDCYPADYDGVMDLDLKFDTQEVVATLGDVSDGDQVTVSLSFDTMDGKSWTGEDCIWIIKKKKER